MSVTIINQPMDFVGAVGDTCVFWVDTAERGLTYTWEIKTNPSGTKWNTSSIDSSIYSVEVTSVRFQYQYRCIVSDGETSITTPITRIIAGTPSPIAAQLYRIKAGIYSIMHALVGKNVTPPDDYKLDDIPALIDQIGTT